MTTEENIKLDKECGGLVVGDIGRRSTVNLVFSPDGLDAYTAKVRLDAYKRGHIDGLKGWEIIDVESAIEQQPSEVKEPCAAQWDEIARLNVGWMKANQAILGKDEEIVALRDLADRNARAEERACKELSVANALLSCIAEILHYPEGWDTAAYPSLDSAVTEIFDCSVCANPEAHGIFPSCHKKMKRKGKK